MWVDTGHVRAKLRTDAQGFRDHGTLHPASVDAPTDSEPRADHIKNDHQWMHGTPRLVARVVPRVNADDVPDRHVHRPPGCSLKSRTAPCMSRPYGDTAENSQEESPSQSRCVSRSVGHAKQSPKLLATLLHPHSGPFAKRRRRLRAEHRAQSVADRLMFDYSRPVDLLRLSLSNGTVSIRARSAEAVSS